MSEQTEPVLLTERRGDILILTINRPSAGNSVNPELAKGIDDALNMAEGDDTIHCVILTAADRKIFCSGMDLSIWPSTAWRGRPSPAAASPD